MSFSDQGSGGNRSGKNFKRDGNRSGNGGNGGKKNFGRKDGNKKPWGDQKNNSGGDKPWKKKSYGEGGGSGEDKPWKKKSYGDSSSGGDKPWKKKSYGDSSSGGDKPWKKKTYGDGGSGSGEDKPWKKKSYGDNNSGGDRPWKKKTYGDGGSGSGEDRPWKKKSYGDGGSGSGEDRPWKKKSYGDGGSGSGEDRPWKKKTYGDGGSGGGEDKPWKKKSYGDNNSGGDRPWKKKTYGDGGSGSGEDKPWKKKSYGDNNSGGDRPWKKKSYGDGGSGGGEDKPWKKKSYGDGGSGSDRPWKKKPFDNKDGFKKRPFRKFDEPQSYSPERDDNWQVFDNDAAAQKFIEQYSDQKAPDISPELVEAVRLNKFIANTGLCSRREADELITAGAIKVNGKVVTELGTKIKPSDTIHYGDQLLRRERMVYILLNKPKDYITTTDDPQERKTVMHLVADACDERVFPVGRLDRNTTGLLLLTNDGDLAERLMHPRYGIRKIYHVELDRNLSKDDFEKIANGLELEDGMITVDEISYVGDESSRNEIGIVIHSGRNRIVRRIFEQLEYKVVRLDRVSYAGLTKRDLPRGRWRFLRPDEVGQLKMTVGRKK